MALYLTLFSGTNRLMLLNPTWRNWPAQAFIWPCSVPKIWNIYSQKWSCPASLQISKFMYLWLIYIVPRSVCLLCYRRIGGPIVVIYKSLTDTWLWKLGLRPLSSFSGNTKIGISLQCGYPHLSGLLGSCGGGGCGHMGRAEPRGVGIVVAAHLTWNRKIIL